MYLRGRPRNSFEDQSSNTSSLRSLLTPWPFFITNDFIKRSSSKRISQREIAETAQVSGAVVSAVLSDAPSSIRVSEATRKRVLEAADRLGYRRRFLAVNATGRPRTRMVAWIESPPIASGEEEWIASSYAGFYRRIMNSVIETLAPQNLTLVVKHIDDHLTQWLVDSRVEAVVWRGGVLHRPLLEWIAARFPVVSANFFVDGVDSIRANPGLNVKVAARALYEQGHRKIAYFGKGSGVLLDRQLAYEAFMAEHSLEKCAEILQLEDSMSVPSVPKANAILDTWERLGGRRPTALITGDVFALQVLKIARSRSISIPDELSVVGIDNIAACEVSHPPLTSVPQPLEEVGRGAAELLLTRMAAPSQSIRMIEIYSDKLEVRHSVARLETGVKRQKQRRVPAAA